MVDRTSANRGTPPTRGTASGKQGAGTTGSEAKQQAGDVVSQVKDQAMQLKDQVTEQVAGTATSKLDEQKGQATSGLATVSQVVHKTGDELRSRDQDMLAGYIDQAAGQLDRVTGYLRNRDVGELIRDVESFARREPTLFLGGAFALGLLGARFLKSSGQATQTPYRSGQGTQAAMSSYSSYSAMSDTQRFPVQSADHGPAISGAGTGAYRTPATAGGASSSSAVGAAGLNSVGMGGSAQPSQPSGTNSAGTGAPGYQAGASTPGARGTGAQRHETGSAIPTSMTGGGAASPSTRSGGDADV